VTDSSFLALAGRRRSTRKYLPAPVPREALERCLEAARLAPSACNSQPWRFIVAEEPALVRELGNAAFSGIYSMMGFAREAPVVVAIMTERSTYAARLGGRFRGVQYSLIDIGIAGEHFALQAEEEGLGTCWLGWFNENGVKKVLGLDRKAKVDVLISVGYPAEGQVPKKTRKPLDEIRRYVR